MRNMFETMYEANGVVFYAQVGIYTAAGGDRWTTATSTC